MTQTLPLAVVRYLAATTPEQVADCFTEDGLALDERRSHQGRDAILRWREEVAKIRYRQDILSGDHSGDRAQVRCRLTGDFKGSPVELDYRFDLAGDRIARLEIS
ncbi:MAG: nuclear transport factor 2 family protein [Rhodobacteraceae bacterium]|nr:nuclear transport factor 2 family protein [Paracoccaceae bacterium]MBR9820184.1 nuclear transport factor 2 family protein [Paracoccaceae bacterium]